VSDRKIILTLAGPAVLQTVIRSLFVIVDAFWVGKMGSVPLAALTSAAFLVWGFLALGEKIAVGTNALVAQATGGGNQELSRRISANNIVNTFLYTILLSLLLIPLLPLLYSLMNISGEQESLCNSYLVMLLLGFPCITLLSTTAAIFRGYGDTKTPFMLFSLGVSLNFILAPVFIFGFSIIPPLGITGAALSTLSAFLTAFLTGLYILKRRKLIDKITNYRFDKGIIKETFRIGLPIALNGVGFSLIYVFVSRFVIEYGPDAIAALGIGHRSESLAYQITVGFSLASSVLVGQNIGAGNPDRAEKLAWQILGYASALMLVYGALLFVFSEEVARFFINDEKVIATASVYNKIAACVQIFSAAEVILSGAFSGAGDSLPPAIVGLPLNFLRIPLTALFSVLWGLTGIWIAICVTVVIKGLIMSVWFKEGRWKKRKLALK